MTDKFGAHYHKVIDVLDDMVLKEDHKAKAMLKEIADTLDKSLSAIEKGHVKRLKMIEENATLSRAEKDDLRHNFSLTNAMQRDTVLQAFNDLARMRMQQLENGNAKSHVKRVQKRARRAQHSGRRGHR